MCVNDKWSITSEVDLNVAKKKKPLSQVLNCEMNNFATGEAFIRGKFDYGETGSLLR